MLTHVAQYTARQFARAIVMPNLSPPVTTAEEGRAYRDRINAAVPAGLDFTPLIVAYLTDHSDPHEIARGHAEGVFTAARSEEHTSELQSLMRISYAVFCLKKKRQHNKYKNTNH